ncbi:MAG: hypothetical protein CM15mP52_2330 [Candidatus Neomarinimicrobiota bacterium]|nr:MAG: hypothetical protein CM15mP52_2330 [Candidatus Neomarinimicrobiota bacterium]
MGATVIYSFLTAAADSVAGYSTIRHVSYGWPQLWPGIYDEYAACLGTGALQNACAAIFAKATMANG